MAAVAADDVGQIRFGIDGVELAGLDQGVEDRRAIAAGMGAQEGPCAAPQGQWSDGPFGGVVDHLQEAVFSKAVSRGSQREVLAKPRSVAYGPCLQLNRTGLMREAPRRPRATFAL